MRNSLPPQQQSNVDALSRQLDLEEGGPPSTAKPPVPPTSSAPPQEGFVARTKKDLSIGYRSGVSHLEQTLANATKAAPVEALKKWGQSEEETAENTAPKAEELAGHADVWDMIAQGAGQLVPSLVENLPAMAMHGRAKKFAPVVAGGIAALGAANEGPEKTAEAAAEAGIGWALLGRTSEIEHPMGRIAASAAAMAAPAALESRGDLRKTAAATVLGGALAVPGPHEFTPEMARKALKGGKDAIEATADSIHRTLDPDSARTRIIIEAPSDKFPSGRKYLAPDDRAKYTKEVLISAMADRARSSSIARTGLNEALKVTAKLTPEQAYGETGWYSARETGGQVPFSDPSMKAVADVFGNAMKAKAKQLENLTQIDPSRVTIEGGKPVNKTGRIVDIYENYAPRIYKDPKKAAAYMLAKGKPVEDWPAGDPRRAASGRRPLGGPGNRFKARTTELDPVTGESTGVLAFQTMSQAVKAGIEPAYKNPGEMFLAAMSEVDRAIMMEKVKNLLGPSRDYTTMRGGEGVLKLRPFYQDRPSQGYEELPGNDWIAYGMNQAGERVRIGHLDAPTGVAQIIKNHLSPGWSGEPWYRGLRSIGNAQNFATLGLSAYHAGMTAMQAVTSDIALGLEKIFEGSRIDSAVNGERLKTIGSGIKDILPTGAMFRDPLRAYSIRQELRAPGSTKNAFVEQTAAQFVAAGGRDGLDPQYRTQILERMKEAHRDGRTIASVVRVPGAALEVFSKPILEHYVPLQKMAAFAKLADFELKKLGNDATDRQKTQAYQTAYKSVENRFGQLTYDNIFWDKTVKDLGIIVFRALGYKLGTWREIGGGAKDWATFMHDIPSHRRAEFTHRMAYTIAMPMAVAIAGAITNYIMVGLNDPRAKQDPSIAYPTGKDYFSPRIGTKDEYGHDERVQFPNYLTHDLHSALGSGWSGPLKYLESSMHPLLTSTFQLIQNSDWSNTEIINSHDPLMKQLQDLLGYGIGQVTPLGLRNAERVNTGNAPPAMEVAPFIGITIAPSSVKRSDAENYAAELMAKEGKTAKHTQEDAQRRDGIKEIRTAIKTGTDPRPAIQRLKNEGLISPYDLKKAGQQLNVSSLWMDLRWLDFDDALRVYIKSSPEERAQLQPLIAHKRTLWEREAGQRKNELEKTRTMELWNQAISLGVPGGR